MRWWQQDELVRSDAVVALAGKGNRRPLALSLVERHLAPVLVVADGDRRSDRHPLNPPWGVEVVRFVPDPFTTRGEARFVAELARERGWGRVIVVAGRAQVGRARLRFRRCWPNGEVCVVAPPDRVGVFDVLYEIGATMKAFIYQRGC